MELKFFINETIYSAISINQLCNGAENRDKEASISLIAHWHSSIDWDGFKQRLSFIGVKNTCFKPKDAELTDHLPTLKIG